MENFNIKSKFVLEKFQFDQDFIITPVKNMNSNSSIEIPLLMDTNVDSSFNELNLTNYNEFSNNNVWYRGYYLQYYNGHKYFLDDFYLSNSDSSLKIQHAGHHFNTLLNYISNDNNINNLSLRYYLNSNIELQAKLGHNLSYFCSH